jgi:hypothetical protein
MSLPFDQQVQLVGCPLGRSEAHNLRRVWNLSTEIALIESTYCIGVS